MRAARDLVPHLPQLLPGLHKTMELFVRQLGARWAIRFAESLAPGSQYGGQAGQYGGPPFGGQEYGGQPGQYGQSLPQQQQQPFYSRQAYPQQQQQQQQQPYWGQQQQGGYHPLPPQQQQFGGAGNPDFGASGLEGAWGQQKPVHVNKKK
jgi:hypothetical protein